jgi:hypothetical protein
MGTLSLDSAGLISAFHFNITPCLYFLVSVFTKESIKHNTGTKSIFLKKQPATKKQQMWWKIEIDIKITLGRDQK